MLLLFMFLLGWGLYMLCTESLEDVQKDFGVK